MGVTTSFSRIILVTKLFPSSIRNNKFYREIYVRNNFITISAWAYDKNIFFNNMYDIPSYKSILSKTEMLQTQFVKHRSKKQFKNEENSKKSDRCVCQLQGQRRQLGDIEKRKLLALGIEKATRRYREKKAISPSDRESSSSILSR